MLDVLSQMFQGNNANPNISNLRQQLMQQYMQQQSQPQQQMQPGQGMQMQNPMASNLRQQLYLQNLMNQGSQGFGSTFQGAPNSIPGMPWAGGLNPAVRGFDPNAVRPQTPATTPQNQMGQNLKHGGFGGGILDMIQRNASQYY